MSNWSSLNSLDSNIRTVCLKPIVSDAAKTFGTFAAEVVLSWVSQIDPSISRHYDIAGNTSCAESGIGKEANFILLGCLVLVPLNFLIPVVVISEGPVDNWMVILHFDFDSVSWVSSPRGRSLCMYLSKYAQNGE